MMSNESTSDTLATISGQVGPDGFRRVDPPATERHILQPKAKKEPVEMQTKSTETKTSKPKEPISDERRRQLLARLGEPIPAITSADSVDFSLMRSSEGALQLLCPPGYSTTEGPLQRRVQARVLVKVGQDGETQRIISITIPSLTGPSREKILFPEPNPAVEAALAAILNPPEKQGLGGLKDVVRSRLMRLVAPALLSAGLALALAGDSVKPVNAGGADVPQPTLAGDESLVPTEDSGAQFVPNEISSLSDSKPQQPEKDASNDPVILTLEAGSNRWDMIGDYLSTTFGLSGADLSRTTATLVRLDREHSDVDDQEALDDMSGAEITLPSKKDIGLIVASIQGNGREDVTEALEPVANPTDFPHSFQQGGSDADEAAKLRATLAGIQGNNPTADDQLSQ